MAGRVLDDDHRFGIALDDHQGHAGERLGDRHRDLERLVGGQVGGLDKGLAVAGAGETANNGMVDGDQVIGMHGSEERPIGRLAGHLLPEVEPFSDGAPPAGSVGGAQVDKEEVGLFGGKVLGHLL